MRKTQRGTELARAALQVGVAENAVFRGLKGLSLKGSETFQTRRTNLKEVLMIPLARLASVFGLIMLPQWASASDDYISRCVDASIPKSAIAEHNGRWIELTGDQWQFLRGIYAMNPQTPAGLPYGDHAVLAQIAGDSGGLIFFIDGDKACTPMAAPKELLSMMQDVATHTINHETGGL